MSYPTVAISLNTHRTHPENLQDEIVLKNLIKHAEERILTEISEREVSEILTKLATIENKVDIKYLQDSFKILQISFNLILFSLNLYSLKIQ